MKSLKNYDGNFEIFERKNKFKNLKQNYKKEKTLCGDYFIDISDYRDDENSINKNFINLCKEEKFIRIDQNISLEEDDLIDTCKEEEDQNGDDEDNVGSHDVVPDQAILSILDLFNVHGHGTILFVVGHDQWPEVGIPVADEGEQCDGHHGRLTHREHDTGLNLKFGCFVQTRRLD